MYTCNNSNKHIMPKPKTQRTRKPQISVEKSLHELIKTIATTRKDKIEKVTDELLVAGLKVKRLLPENFPSS